MSPSFHRKKLSPSSAVGVLLRQRRQELALSLEELEERTNIRFRYLLAIESGRTADIPVVYVSGYLRQYAQALDLDPDNLSQQFIREQPLVTSALRFAPPQLQRHRVVEVTPKRLLVGLLLSGCLVVVGLVGLQLFRFTAVPTVELSLPKERFVASSDGSVTFRGLVIGHRELLVNNQPVVTTPEGNFDQRFHFDPGITQVELVATGRQGKVAKRLFTVSVPQPAARKE